MTFTTAEGVSRRSAAALIRRRARTHSRLVFVVRWLLPTIILALLSLLGVFVVSQALRAAASKPREIPTEIRMVSPHFIGRDDQGRAFDLAARLAVRDDANMQHVVLGSPVLVLDVESAHPKTLTADRGVYDEKTRLLRLTGHVRVDDSTASTVATDEALVDTKAGVVTGVSSLNGSGPMGMISAGSYSASEKGQTLELHGGVHAELKGK
ncbi:MAG TPA: LPS export ABC transporter periplasmic protein LptC [Caulobacteraceae bacterium]|nr:LPS export ABC transporter periplasmic protein LptC [Caulobacteraceae bacterium]